MDRIVGRIGHIYIIRRRIGHIYPLRKLGGISGCKNKAKDKMSEEK